MKAIVYPVDGEPHEVEAVMSASGGPALAWLYETIGCDMVQFVPMPNGDLWVDEDGKVKGDIHVNPKATSEFSPHLFPGDCIVGVAVFFPSSEVTS